MRKLLIPAAATFLIAAASIANAGEAMGVIKSIDAMKDTVTLDNGATYQAPASIKLSGFKIGEKVNVTYSQSAGKMEISALKPAA